jgi:Transposase DDE domain
MPEDARGCHIWYTYVIIYATGTPSTSPTKAERKTMPAALQRFIADHRGRIESTYNTLKDQLHLEHHRAKTFWGLLTRIMGKLAAYTLRDVWRHAGLAVE